MDSALETYLTSWPFDPWLIASLLVTAGIYVRGWLSLHSRVVSRWDWRQLAAFAGGLGMIFLALGSPVETYAPFLLQVHMAQHLLLMMAAPPLLWLGLPLIPLLRGLPSPVRTYWVAPIFRSTPVRRCFETLTRPGPALVLFTATSWLWHLPPLYELALRSDRWHYVQHICFLLAGLLFWYPVVRPFPARPTWSSWLLIPYLILADVQNTVLSALLTFSNRVLYPYYEEVPRLGGLSALTDQSTAGVLMWVPGSIAYLVPLFAIGVGMLFGTADSSRSARRVLRPVNGRLALPLVSRRRQTRSVFDLLRIPLVGPVLQRRPTRLAVQTIMLLLAVVVIVDGLAGKQVGAMNLAGVLPWVHWRGFLILGLLSAGNVFCYACPFTLPRTVAGRWIAPGWDWPRPLRSKWLAVGLLVVFLWAYEAFALWDSPWWTAWIAIGYFVGAFAIDSVFRGGTFCKYVCPVGQFNFVQSLVSPLEVKARDAAVCGTCRTRDCIQGRGDAPGCATGLFQPRKAGNFDCTFCLDCVRACPHDNVGILSVTPAAELWRDTFRSGIGRFARRTDVAALVLVLVFGAFINAAGMVAPVVQWLDALSSWLGQATPLLATTAFYLVGLGFLPLVAVGSAAACSRRWGRLSDSALVVANRFIFALIPLGFAMWLAHYSFHLLTGYDAAIPAAQRFADDWGWPAGEPDWVYACCRAVPAWLFRAEILCLDIGLLLSLYAGQRIARDQSLRPLRALAPWALLMVFLFAAGVWTVLQPMQMRGTLPAGR
jgi:cytochrome c oxidase assembly factor CtaG/polyferredoxin